MCLANLRIDRGTGDAAMGEHDAHRWAGAMRIGGRAVRRRAGANGFVDLRIGRGAGDAATGVRDVRRWVGTMCAGGRPRWAQAGRGKIICGGEVC